MNEAAWNELTEKVEHLLRVSVERLREGQSLDERVGWLGGVAVRLSSLYMFMNAFAGGCARALACLADAGLIQCIEQSLTSQYERFAEEVLCALLCLHTLLSGGIKQSNKSKYIHLITSN